MRAALAEPVSTQTLALERLQRAARKRQGLFASAPWPDPENLNAQALEREYRSRIDSKINAARAEADRSANLAELARRNRRLIDTILPTAAALRAADLKADAERARQAADIAEELRMSHYRAAASSAREVVRTRQRARAAWEQQPVVQQAYDEDRLDRLIIQQIDDGDVVLAGLVVGFGLDAARDDVRRREQWGRSTPLLSGFQQGPGFSGRRS